jgi:hypothetical protein
MTGAIMIPALICSQESTGSPANTRRRIAGIDHDGQALAYNSLILHPK